MGTNRSQVPNPVVPGAYDRFEPYYGLFFSLLEADERILYLDAEQGRDGISTIVKTPWGEPLLIHSWYAREWADDLVTRERYRELVEFVREFRKGKTEGALDGPRGSPRELALVSAATP